MLFDVFISIKPQPLASKGNDLIDYTNKTDSLGNKQGKWIIYFDSTWNEVKSDENPYYYRLIEFKDNKPQGLVQDFWISGEKQWEGFLISSNPDTLIGKSTFYYRNGNKDSEGHYEYGIKIGFWDYFHEDGTIDSLTSILDYAERLFYDGKNDNADSLLILIRNLIINSSSKYSCEYLMTLNLMIKSYFEQRKYEEIYNLTSEILEISNKNSYKSCKEIAESFIYLGDYWRSCQDNYLAEKYYRNAYSIIKNHFDFDSLNKNTKKIYLLTLSRIGLFLYERNRYFEAEFYLSEYKRKLNIFSYSYVLDTLGILYRLIGKYDQSFNILDWISFLKKHFYYEPISLAFTLNQLGRTLIDMGLYPEAEIKLLEAFNIYNDVNYFSDDFLFCLDNLTELYIKYGKYFKAEKLLTESINKLAIETEDYHSIKFYLKPNLCELLRIMGRDYQANKILSDLESEVDTNKSKSYDYFSDLKTNEILKDYEVDIEFYNDELNKNEMEYGSESFEVSITLKNLAYIYLMIDSLDLAENLYNKALQIQKKIVGERSLLFLNTCEELSVLNFYKNNLIEATELLKYLINQYKYIFGTDNPKLVKYMNVLAYIFTFQKRYDEADSLLRESLVLTKLNRIRHPKDYYNSINSIIDLYFEMEKFTNIEPLYKEICSNRIYFFRTQSLYLTEQEKEQFWSTIIDDFEKFNSFVLKRIEENPAITEQALNNVLFTKAMLLNSTINVKQRILKSGNKEAISIYQNWISTRELLNKLYSLSIDEQKKSGYDIDSLENSSNELEKKLNLLSTDFAKASDRKQYTFNDLKSTLKENECAIEIIRFNYFMKRWTDTVYYIALIVNKETKDYPKLVLLDNGNEIENELFAKYKSDIASPKGIYSDYKTTLKEIYTKIWKPIKDALPKNTETIYLSVDGIYNKINLNSLINPETGNYLLSESDIRIVTSTRDIAENRKSSEERKTSKTAALFGFPKYDLDSTRYNALAVNYQRDIDENLYGSTLDSIRAGQWDQLPGTKYEIEMIDSLLKKEKWKTKKYLGEEALEEAVKSLESPSILHIATHGYFLSSEEIERRYDEGRLSPRMFGMETYRAYRDPLLRSGLLMAGAKSGMEEESIINRNRDNGILTAKEVMNLNLDNTDLVVLSACETGLGDIKNGEGVYGLQRAFVVAGAKTLVNSLWKVPDKETQELMKKFYTYWIKGGKTKSEAFRQAQKDMINLHPYYWAAFVMVGG